MKVALRYRFSVLLKDKSAGIMHANMDNAAEVAIWIIQGFAFFFFFFFLTFAIRLNWFTFFFLKKIFTGLRFSCIANAWKSPPSHKICYTSCFDIPTWLFVLCLEAGNNLFVCFFSCVSQPLLNVAATISALSLPFDMKALIFYPFSDLVFSSLTSMVQPCMINH